jgi:hypothetical protein
MAHLTAFNCWICGKPVSLETCKTDERGKPVHEDCYVTVIRLNGASGKQKLPPSEAA